MAETERTRLKRLPDRGSFDRSTVHAILDAGYICHLGFTTERGPVVIPTCYGRVGDELFVHGSPASRMLRSMTKGVDVCCTVTLVDELVLARSAFHHSINFRSVVVFGEAVEVTDLERKREALLAFVDHVVPGRSTDTRPPTDKELRGTLVLALPIEEASAKVRTGPPVDDPEDLELPVWAGVLPVPAAALTPVPDTLLAPTISPPTYLTDYRRPSTLLGA